MEFIFEKFRKGDNYLGTYKITFDNKWFYIGSSTNLRKRCMKWKYSLTTGKFLKQKNIKSILPTARVIKFEIIGFYTDTDTLRAAENALLKKYWDNKCMLNRCPTSESPKGMRPYLGYVPPIKKKRPLIPIGSKSVAKFTIHNVFVCVYPSIAAASRAIKCKENSVREFLKGKHRHVKGFLFKLVSHDAGYIEPIKFIRKSPPTGRTPTNARSVLQRDNYGKVVNCFDSITDAAKSLGCSKENIFAAATKNGRRKSAKGFSFEYA